MDLPGLSVKFGMDHSGFDSGVSHVKQSASSLGSAFSGMGAALSSALTTAAGFVIAQEGMRAFGAAASFAKESAIGLNDSLQQAKIGFTTMLGSASAADSFLQQMAQFAATTPFQFLDVTKAAQSLMAYGFAAKETLPLLTDIGNVSSAFGAGQQGIDAMTRAIGQMNASVILHTQDLNQMVQVGVPVWTILADATGKSTAQVRQMVEQGQIASDVFIKAFDEWSRAKFGDMMEQQSHTFSGAMSTIHDVLQMGIAQGLRPFFDEIAKDADKLGQLLQTQKFQDFVVKIQTGSAQIVSSLKNIFQNIHDDGLVATLSHAQQTLDQFASNLFTAGWNAMVTYAQGMASGAREVLQSTVSGIAQTVADYFVGHSPPPKGPLSEVDTGGANVGKAWVKGLGIGFAGVTAVAEKAASVFSVLNLSMTLPDGQAELAKAKDDLDGLTQAGKDVDAQIKIIDHALASLQDEAYDLNTRIDAITSAYQDQIDPLQKQVDLLNQAESLEQKRVDLQEQLRQVQISRMQIEAQGDPAQREALNQQMDVVKSKEDEHDLDKQIADIQQQIADATKSTSDAQGGLTENERIELDLKLKGAATFEQRQKVLDDLQAKIDADKAKGIDVTYRQKQLDEQQLQLANAEKKAGYNPTESSTSKSSAPDVEGLQLKLQELQIQKQLNDLVNEPLELKAESDQRQLDSKKQIQDLDNQEIAARKEMLALPIEAQISKLKDEQAAALKPLQDALALNQSQTAEINHQRQGWQLLKGDINDAMQPLQDALDAQKKADAEKKAKADKAGKDAGPSVDLAPGEARLPTTDIGGANGPGEGLHKAFNDSAQIDFGQIGRDWAKRIGDGIKNYIKDNWGRLIGGAIGALAGSFLDEYLGPFGTWLGAGIGARLGESFQHKMEEIDMKSALQTMVARLKAGDFANAFKPLGDALGPTLSQVWQRIQESAPGFLANLGILLAKASAWLSTDGLAFIIEATAKLSGALIDWVVPRIPDLLAGLGMLLLAVGDWAVTVFLPFWAKKLAEWGLALVSWAEPRIPELLKGLGNMLFRLNDWVNNDANVAIQNALVSWAKSFISWLDPKAVDLLKGADGLLHSVVDWINNVNPSIQDALTSWASSFTGWIGDVVKKIPDEAGKILSALSDWATKTAKDGIASIGGTIADTLITGITDGIGSLAHKLGEALKSAILDSLPDALKGAGEKIWNAGKSLVPGHAAGVQSFMGGLSLVGEAGPELVNLPRGADVVGTGQTGALLSQLQGHGPSHITIPVNIGGQELYKILVDLMGHQATRTY